MKFIIERDTLLPMLQDVANIVERRQTLPVLSCLLFRLEPERLTITATDAEVELVIHASLDLGETGAVTLPARKLFDICRSLPAESSLAFEVKPDRVAIKSGKSRFTLSSLPAGEYPLIDIKENSGTFKLEQRRLRTILENTRFAMAQQDVRYYLNGLLLEIDKNSLRAVATDGHRLALDETDIEGAEETVQVIVPRKGVNELTRLLPDSEAEIEIEISANHIRLKNDAFCFTSKLIDGKFPDYQRVIPEISPGPVIANREQLRNSLARASILSNEKYRGVRIMLAANLLRALAHNPEQEEAEEELEVAYQGEEMEIGFNVSYLLDTLAVIKSEQVRLSILDTKSSCLVLPDDDSRNRYVVMPMRL